MIEADDSALVTVHVQNDVLHEDGRASMWNIWKFADEIIPNIDKVAKECREKEIPVIHATMEFRSDKVDMGMKSSIWDRAKEEGAFEEDTWGSAVVDRVEVDDGDYFVHNNRTNIFLDTDLATLLRNLGRPTNLIMCGVATDWCLEASVRAASDRDFLPVTLRDGCASFTEERTEWTFENILPDVYGVREERLEGV